jgi:hypothetical protein
VHYVGRVQAVPHLFLLYHGICLTKEEKKAWKNLRVVEKCQLGMIHCVVMAAFCGQQGQVVNPNLCALEDLGQCSVSVDFCHAV